MRLSASQLLPEDRYTGTLVGRVWIESRYPGPRTFLLREDGLHDLSSFASTMSELLDMEDGARRVHENVGSRLCSLDDALHSQALLAPCDLQAIKASGVTFADSLIARIVEEQARGDTNAAAELHDKLATIFGDTLTGIRPGSTKALEAKRALIANGLWSAYLEVGLGEDAEIFTKAQPLSSVGCGAKMSLHPRSTWTNSEPEIVLAVSSRGEPIGASLGNDLTLCDFEGRSALLLGRAKDINASCAIGPFIRLFDDTFDINDVRHADVELDIVGEDGFRVAGTNSMHQCSRDPVELIDATMGADHQYPDGLMLFLGTMFVANEDRHGKGRGFCHESGDVISIRSPKLGLLRNVLAHSAEVPRWNYGVRALMNSLFERGLLNRSHRAAGP